MTPSQSDRIAQPWPRAFTCRTLNRPQRSAGAYRCFCCPAQSPTADKRWFWSATALW